MNPKGSLFIFSLFLGLTFIGIGDNFLPQPLSNVSSNTRSSVNQFLMGLFPDKKAIDPYERTEGIIKEAEKEEN